MAAAVRKAASPSTQPEADSSPARPCGAKASTSVTSPDDARVLCRAWIEASPAPQDGQSARLSAGFDARIAGIRARHAYPRRERGDEPMGLERTRRRF